MENFSQSRGCAQRKVFHLGGVKMSDG